MALATQALTYEEFVSRYGDKTHEYWYGEAMPKGMDVIAFSNLPKEEYPMLGPPVVVEIISEDDKVPAVREHCQKYELWGRERIYLVDPSDHSVVRWDRGSQIVCSELAGIPVERISEKWVCPFSRETL